MFGFAVIGHRINPIKQNSATINTDGPAAMKIFLLQVAPKPIQILLLTRSHRLSAVKIQRRLKIISAHPRHRQGVNRTGTFFFQGKRTFPKR